MTTDTQDFSHLRVLAEAAPRFKEWKVLPARQDEGYAESHSIYMEGYGALGYWKGHKSHHTDADWLLTKESAEFLCAANPNTVIALLDKIEALQAGVERYIALKRKAEEDTDDARAYGREADNEVKQLTAERDAALARLAELQKQEPCAVFLGWNADGSANLDAACEGPETLCENDTLYRKAGASPVEPNVYEARYKRLEALEAQLVPEGRIIYYLNNPQELDRLIKLDGIAKEQL
jgi:hypothetical protein